MSSPVYVMPPALTVQGQPVARTSELADLLRQLVAAQQEQVNLLKAQAAKEDSQARWRAFLARWGDEFPGIGSTCKELLPTLERAYLSMVRDVTDRLASDPELLTDEFMMAEFLDRYGMRLGQLGNVLSQLSPLADAAPREE